MRPKRFTVTASAGGPSISPAYPVDINTNPTDIGIIVKVTGSALYTVQHTGDDPWSTNLNASVSAAEWLNNSFLVSANANGDTNYIAAPNAIRLVLYAAASATATITINPAGPR